MDDVDDLTLCFITEYRLKDHIFNPKTEVVSTQNEQERLSNVSTGMNSINAGMNSFNAGMNINNVEMLNNDNNNEEKNKKSRWIKQEIEILPKNDILNIRSVSCFINELDDFKKTPRRSYLKTYSEGIRTSIFTFVRREELSYYISVHIWLCMFMHQFFGYFQPGPKNQKKKCYSFLRSRNRTRKRPLEQENFYYEKIISKLSPGTAAILLRKPLICTGIYDFSSVFNFFVKRLIENEINCNDETDFLFEYYRMFYQSKCKSVTSLKDLKKNLKGYLKFNIQKSSKKKKVM